MVKGAASRSRCLIAGACLAFAGAVNAQQAPDAGQTIRQIEREAPALRLPPRSAPALSTEPLRPPLEAAPAARIPVKSIRITGVTALSVSELAALVKDIEGREVSLDELERAAQRITQYYRERGYVVARAYIPAQDIREGVVEIAVIEGRIGRVELRNRSLLNDRGAGQTLEAAVPGAVVQEETLERGLLLLSDTPGVVVTRAGLQPGASVGTSDLVVDLDATRAISGFADLDNYGNRFTGVYRFGASGNLNSPLGIGDVLTARVIGSDGDFSYGRIAYQIPLGTSGLRVGAAYFDTRYRLGSDFAALNANGEGNSTSAYAVYPVVRSRRVNLNAVASYEAKRLEDRVGATGTLTSKSVDVFSLGVSGDARDALGGGGIWNYSLAWTGGDLRIGSAAALAADAAGPRANGGYDKVSYSVSRLQFLSDEMTLYASLSGQQAGKNLDSSEKFGLGGATGVRGYPPGEASGDEGYLASLELRRRMGAWGGGNLQLALFHDWGSVKISHSPFAAGSNSRHIAGLGMGVNWVYEEAWVVRASLAWKAGSGPALSDTDRPTRFWVQAVRYF